MSSEQKYIMILNADRRPLATEVIWNRIESRFKVPRKQGSSVSYFGISERADELINAATAFLSIWHGPCGPANEEAKANHTFPPLPR